MEYTVIVIRRRPYEYNFSGNSIVYELFDQQAIADADITFEIRIILKRFEEPGEIELAILPLTPYLGVAKVDLKDVLTCKLEYQLPDPDDALPVKGTGKQSGSFHIEFRAVKPSNTNTSWNTSESEYQRFIFKGGIAPFQWNNNSFFTSYFPEAKPFFTWQKNGRLVSLNESIWLSWLNTDFNTAAVPAVRVRITVNYTDSSTAQKIFNILPLSQFHFYYIPVGADQVGLSLLNPNKTIWFWEIKLEDISTPDAPVTISQTFRFEQDMRNDYNRVTLHYRNSLGGMDPVRVRGVIETTGNLEGTDSEHAPDIDWSFQTSLARMDKSLPHREALIYKGDIGHLDKEEQDRLRDAFLNREVYLINLDRWWPVKLITKQYRLGASTDKRFTMPIEWTIADGGSFFYTPKNIIMGPGVSTNNLCSSTIQITHLGIVFNGGLANLSFNYSVFGGFLKLQWRVPDFQDAWKDFNSDDTGTLQVTVPKGAQGIVNMRTICVGQAAGAIETHEFDAREVIPIYNSSVYNETPYPFTCLIKYANPFQTLFTGPVLPGLSKNFHSPDGPNAKITVTMLLHKPAFAYLKSNDITYKGVVTGATVVFDNVNIINGCIIIIDDK